MSEHDTYSPLQGRSMCCAIAAAALRYFRLHAVPLLGACLLCTTACGPVHTNREIHHAYSELQLAGEAGGDDYAPYEMVKAELYLRKAEETRGYADFHAAYRFATSARKSAQRAHLIGSKSGIELPTGVDGAPIVEPEAVEVQPAVQPAPSEPEPLIDTTEDEPEFVDAPLDEVDAAEANPPDVIDTEEDDDSLFLDSDEE